MIAYQSSQTATGTTSLVITKPVDTAVGDLLIASISTANDSDHTPPTGWTLLGSLNINAGTPYAGIRIYYVIATSTQVSASNFTWTPASESRMAGGISRFTGNFTSFSSTNSGARGTSATPTYANTITPATYNNLILFCVCSGDNSESTNTSSDYAIVTSNPTWAEAFDLYSASAGITVHSAMAYAIRPELTATGNSSLVLANSMNSCAFLISVREFQTVTISETTTKSETITALRKLFLSFSETTTKSEIITYLKGRNWTKKTKPVTTWTSKQK